MFQQNSPKDMELCSAIVVNPALPCPMSFTITSAASHRCFLLPATVFAVKEPRLATYGGADAFRNPPHHTLEWRHSPVYGIYIQALRGSFPNFLFFLL